LESPIKQRDESLEQRGMGQNGIAQGRVALDPSTQAGSPKGSDIGRNLHADLDSRACFGTIDGLKSHRLRFGDLDLRAHVKSSRTTNLM